MLFDITRQKAYGKRLSLAVELVLRGHRIKRGLVEGKGKILASSPLSLS